MESLRKYLQTNYLSPTLPLENKWRNTFVFVIAVVWLWVTLDVVIGLISDATVDFVIRRSSNMWLMVTLPFGLLRARSQVYVSNWVLTYFFQVIAIGLSFSAAKVSPTRPVSFQALLMMVLIAISNVPYWKTQCLTFVPSLVIYSYNGTFGINGYPMWILIAPEEGGLSKELLAHSRLLWLIPLTLTAVRVLSSAFYASLRRLEGSVQVAKRVSEHLADYDTCAAEFVLETYKSNPDCDEDLHSVLSVIVSHMTRYKPFLPNYIVTRENVEEDSNNTREAHASIPVVPPTAETAATINLPSQHHTLSVLRSHQPTTPSQKLLAMVPTMRAVSYALVGFQVHSDDIIDNPQTLRVFVEKVYRYANTTRGAVHTFIGDVIHVTWNATLPVLHSELNAIGMFRYLRNDRENTQSQRIDVYGCVMSGVAECRLTGDSTHQAFLLHITWGPALQVLFRYSSDIEAVVVCQKTVQEISSTYAAMKTDVLDDGVPAFTITTREMVTMYESSFDSILRLYVEENYSEAKRMLQKVMTQQRSIELDIPLFITMLMKRSIVV